MVAISLSEIQKDFPAYLRRVAEGEVFIITEHDRPVAEIVPPSLGSRAENHVALVDYLKSRVNDAHVPQRWQVEGVEVPTENCRRSALELTESLFTAHGLLPAKVVASRQGVSILSTNRPPATVRWGSKSTTNSTR